jgi:RNA polymerase sigma-70 factor (ECF subfamily)
VKPGEPLEPSKAAAGSSDADPDQGLVARARGGDPDAFRALLERHRDRVYALALRIVRSAPDAEEVAQDAFVRAWLALPRFRGEARFSTWLHRIAARRALDRAATLRLRRGREAGLGAGMDPGAPAADAGRDPRVLRLEALIETLPPAQRAAVALYYLEDRSVEQVAKALDMPENTVKTHLGRARAALRAAWLAREG